MEINPAVRNRTELISAIYHLINHSSHRPGIAGIPDPVEDCSRHRHLAFIRFALGFSPDQTGEEFKVCCGEIPAAGVSSGGDHQLLAGIDGIAPQIIETLIAGLSYRISGPEEKGYH